MIGCVSRKCRSEKIMAIFNVAEVSENKSGNSARFFLF